MTPAKITNIGGIDVFRVDNAVLYQSALKVDFDGGRAYHKPTLAHPESGRPPGLDHLGNATENWELEVLPWIKAHPGEDWIKSGVPRWCGIVVGHDGLPLWDENGFGISTTALVDHRVGVISSRSRYVDALAVPYVSISPVLTKLCGLTLGDLGVVLHGGHLLPEAVSGPVKEPASCYAIVADIGPPGRLGEDSAALSQGLGFGFGGRDARDVWHVLFVASHSSPPWPRLADELHAAASAKFADWGGTGRLVAVQAWAAATAAGGAGT